MSSVCISDPQKSRIQCRGFRSLNTDSLWHDEVGRGRRDDFSVAYSCINVGLCTRTSLHSPHFSPFYSLRLVLFLRAQYLTTLTAHDYGWWIIEITVASQACLCSVDMRDSVLPVDTAVPADSPAVDGFVAAEGRSRGQLAESSGSRGTERFLNHAGLSFRLWVVPPVKPAVLRAPAGTVEVAW
jgi:hypothetical protein